MKLTRIIFDKWKIWMTLPVKTILWSHQADKEGLGFYGFLVLSQPRLV
jgi:hypothetical protein